MNDPRRTAIHEAGHATIALEENCRFEEIVAEREFETDENASVRGLCYSSHESVTRIGVAGIIAVRLTLRQWPAYLFESARDDLGRVASVFKGLGTDRLELERTIAQTALQLIRLWGVVQRIADVVLEKKRLTFKESFGLYAHELAHPTVQTPAGKIGVRGWLPLVEHIKWRMKYPNGLADVAAELDRLASNSGD